MLVTIQRITIMAGVATSCSTSLSPSLFFHYSGSHNIIALRRGDEPQLKETHACMPTMECSHGILIPHYRSFLPQRRVGLLRWCIWYCYDQGHTKWIYFKGVCSSLWAHRQPLVVSSILVHLRCQRQPKQSRWAGTGRPTSATMSQILHQPLHFRLLLRNLLCKIYHRCKQRITWSELQLRVILVIEFSQGLVRAHMMSLCLHLSP